MGKRVRLYRFIGADSMDYLYNIEAEQTLLGLIIVNNDVLLDIDLKPEHFYVPKHQKLYAAMQKLMQEDKTIDVINICNTINAQEVGGISYISDLITHADIALDKNKIEIIKEKYKLRELNKIILKSQNDLKEKKSSDIANDIQQSILNIDDEDKEVLIDDDKLFSNLFFRIDEKMKLEGKIEGLECGISCIDKSLNGFQKGKLYFIAGRPGMGKSALAINLANEIAKKYYTTYFSLEMTAEEIGFRRLALESYVDMAKIERGILSEDELKKINVAANKLYKNKMLINDKAALHINDIYRQAKKLKLKNKLDIVFVDHIGLIRANGDTVREQITNICINLKRMAKELDIPIIALSQLNRSVEQRGEKKPALSDLKESSGIEENADVVMLLYRDEYYNPQTDDKGIIEVNIAKNRNGRTGIIKLMWKPEIQLIRGIM